MRSMHTHRKGNEIMETANQKLTNLQLELMKMFSYQLDEHQLVEVKSILSAYFADKATIEMDKLWNEKKWTKFTMKR